MNNMDLFGESSTKINEGGVREVTNAFTSQYVEALNVNNVDKIKFESFMIDYNKSIRNLMANGGSMEDMAKLENENLGKLNKTLNIELSSEWFAQLVTLYNYTHES